MTKLKYKDENGFWQEFQVGTNVVANPIIAGTESELTGLQVGDTKYKMPAGSGKLYRHDIWTMDGPPSFLKVVVYSSKRTAYTGATFVSDFLQLNKQEGEVVQGISGAVKIDRLIYPLYSIGLNFKNISTLDISGIKSDGSFVDLSYPDYASMHWTDIVTEV